MRIREPLHPVIQNALIMIASGLVASALCAKVYGATLPVDEPNAKTVAASTSVSAPRSNEDAAAAAQLRAMLAGQPVLLGTPTSGAPRQ